MNLRDELSLRYVRLMLGTVEGRAFVLRQLADAESNGEGQIFDRILSQVDDPELRQMIKKHQDDEVRHAELYTAAAIKTGVPMRPVPDQLKLIDRLDRKLGGFLSKPIVDRKGVMEAYLLLQVVEERGITQFQMLERGFREVDPEVADLVRTIAKDEERHLRYCLAISRRYAPDEATLRSTLRRFRNIEALAFAENSEAMMKYVVEQKLFSGGPLVRLFFQTVQKLSARSGQLPYTRYGIAQASA